MCNVIGDVVEDWVKILFDLVNYLYFYGKVVVWLGCKMGYVIWLEFG